MPRGQEQGVGFAASNARCLVFSGTLFPSRPVWWIIQVLDLLRREKYKSSSLFIFQPQMQTLLGFAARLGSITFTKKIRFSWRLSWRLTVPTARRRKSSSFLCLDSPPCGRPCPSLPVLASSCWASPSFLQKISTDLHMVICSPPQ